MLSFVVLLKVLMASVRRSCLLLLLVVVVDGGGVVVVCAPRSGVRTLFVVCVCCVRVDVDVEWSVVVVMEFGLLACLLDVTAWHVACHDVLHDNKH